MSSNSKISWQQIMRSIVALAICLVVIPALHLDLYAQAPASGSYVDLDAEQLDQLVAPIALDADSLIAQILTGATYPDQIAAADSWLNQNMNQPPDQRASAANNMSWDSSIKGLTAFPAVLDNLAKNSAWTAQLGNAYYNQPGDVMNAVQAMRLQAQQSNTLVTTTQQRVVVDSAGIIAIVPVNPAYVYVPYYNPWTVWGALFVAYPGYVVLPPPPGIVVGVGLAFDPVVPVGMYSGFDWGFSAWAPSWGTGTVVFNNNTYISNSTTVYNHGRFGWHDRGCFDHGGRGVPRGFHAHARMGGARDYAARTGSRGRGFGADNRRSGFNGGRPGENHGAYGGHQVNTAGHGGYAGHSGANLNHGAYGNHGPAAPNHGMNGKSGTSTGHPGYGGGRTNTASNHGNYGSRGTASSGHANGTHGVQAPPRNGSAGMRNTSASNRGGATANRGMNTANRGAASGNRGTSSTNRVGSSMNHGGASASRSASAGHASGGHASAPSRGKGR
jgi:hypothetical protein